MITWMQRHKKWLVITIWISTIAFVGAGFVGWGSYDYSRSQGTVAIVGEREVSIAEYQREYSNLYEQYSNVFGAQFNQELAQQLNLQGIAFNSVLQKNLLLSYADELGLDATNEDVVKTLVQMPSFQIDGKFDKDTYLKVLTQNQTNPTDFEAALKRDVILQKMQTIFNITPTANEVSSVATLYDIEDNVDVKVLDSKSVTIDIQDDSLRPYWEMNKGNFLSDAAFELETEVFNIISQEVSDAEINDYYSKFKSEFTKEDGMIKTLEEAKEDIKKAILLQATKKDALKAYIELKKANKTFTNKQTSFINELNFAQEDIDAINSAKEGEILKPILQNDGYIVIKINKKIQPQPLSFEQALPKVKEEYLSTERQIKVAQQAQELLADFKGENLGYVTATSSVNIQGLSQDEQAEFLSKLFQVNEAKGIIEVADKLVVYKINDARLKAVDASQNESILTTLTSLQNSEVIENLVESLEKKYEVRSLLEESTKEN